MTKKRIISVLIVLSMLCSAASLLVLNNSGPSPSALPAVVLPDEGLPAGEEDGPSVVGPFATDSDESNVGGDGQQSVIDSDDCGEEEEESSDDCSPVPDCDDEEQGDEDQCGDCDCDDEEQGDEDECPPVPDCECDGCTYTIGYWKNHAGLGKGNQADMITPLITAAGGAIWLGTENGEESVEINSAAEARTYLDRQGDSSNGINRLYAQLLAGKLNILNGACDQAVDDVIAAADVFLAEHGSAEWDCLSAEEQTEVNHWKNVLDNYNNGIIGPGHCE